MEKRDADEMWTMIILRLASERGRTLNKLKGMTEIREDGRLSTPRH